MVKITNDKYAKMFNVPVSVIEKYNNKYSNFGTDVTLKTLYSPKSLYKLNNRLRICKILVIKEHIDNNSFD